jgi:hypothetical protein
MNVKTHDARSTLTLADGRQLEVDGLHVGAAQTRGSVSKERTVDAQGHAQSAWQKLADGPREITLRSADVSRVELRTDKVRGGVIGTLTGAVGGGLVGVGLGYGIGDAASSSGCPSGEVCNIDAILGAVVGGILGAVVFGIVGLFVGKKGVERTYLFAPPEAAVETAVEPVP